MSIEAMKQALEAIANSGDFLFNWHDCEPNNEREMSRYQDVLAMNEKAFNTLRTAIEQAEKQEPVALDSIRLVVLETDHPADKMPIDSQRLFAAGWNAAVDALKKRGPLYTTPPAAPMQGPVAWAKQLSKELLGVITDVEEGDGFDDVCLDTIKYVYEQLATPPAAQEQIQRLTALVRAQQITIDKLEKNT